MGYLLKTASTAKPLLFLMVDSADHISAKTGLTPTVTISKNGAAFAAPAGAVTELANGWYKVAGNATDTGTLGPLVLHATASGSDPVDDTYTVVAFDPDSATNLGLSGIGTAQTGDAYGYLGTNLGALGANAVALAPASTALSTANWTTARAGKIDNLDAAISTRGTSSYAGGDTSGTTTLLARIGGAITISGGKVAAIVASGDDADAASVKATVGVAGAGLTVLATAANLTTLQTTATTIAAQTAAAAIAAALLDVANGIETGWTPRQALRIILAALGGKSSNGGATFRSITDSKARITATVDGSGNRTAVSTDAT